MKINYIRIRNGQQLPIDDNLIGVIKEYIHYDSQKYSMIYWNSLTNLDELDFFLWEVDTGQSDTLLKHLQNYLDYEFELFKISKNEQTDILNWYNQQQWSVCSCVI